MLHVRQVRLIPRGQLPPPTRPPRAQRPPELRTADPEAAYWLEGLLARSPDECMGDDCLGPVDAPIDVAAAAENPLRADAMTAVDAILSTCDGAIGTLPAIGLYRRAPWHPCPRRGLLTSRFGPLWLHRPANAAEGRVGARSGGRVRG